MGKKNNNKSKNTNNILKDIVESNKNDLIQKKEEKVIVDELTNNSICNNNKIINDIITETDDKINDNLIIENIKDIKKEIKIDCIKSKINELKEDFIDSKDIILIDGEVDGKDIKLEIVEENFVKIDINDYKELIKNKDKSIYDFNSKDLLKILNGDIEQNSNDGLNINTSNKFLKKLQKLLPTSNNVADIYFSKDLTVNDNNLTSIFVESSSVDLVSIARNKNRRISVTSNICNKEDCNNNHFNHSGFCMVHDNKQTFNDDDVFFPRYNSLRISFEEDIFYKGPFVDIDGKKVKLDTIYNMKSEILRKKSLMKAITVDREDNFSQLKNQFKKLDVDNDGIITISDLKFMINKVDPSYANTISDEILNEKCTQMIKVTVNRENAKEITYDDYIEGLNLFRSTENNFISESELISTCFWDLRLAFLTIPDVKSLHSCCIYKRGYLLVPESLNGWKERYSCIINNDQVDQINFYAKNDLTGSKSTDIINLFNIQNVDFSPQSEISEKYGKKVSFQISMYEGRRYTLAADVDTAINWISILSWYCAANKLAREWQAAWGTERNSIVTIRDWINCAAVISKMSFSEKLIKEYENAGTKDQKNKIRNQLKEYVLTETDNQILQICGFTDKESLEQASGATLHAIKLYYDNQHTLNQYDQSLTGGIVGYAIEGILNTILVWRFARNTKNRYLQNKYNVIADSKAAARHCSSCYSVFNYMSIRVQHRKYHCRSCGHVVCRNCSSNKIYFEATDSHERVCLNCLKSNGPTEERKTAAFGGSEAARISLMNNLKHETKNIVKDEIIDLVKPLVGGITNNIGNDTCQIGFVTDKEIVNKIENKVTYIVEEKIDESIDNALNFTVDSKQVNNVLDNTNNVVLDTVNKIETKNDKSDKKSLKKKKNKK